jgi:hypothetical protein
MITTRRYDSGLLTADELAATTKLIGHAETKLTDDEHVRHLKDMHIPEYKLANAELAVEVFSPFQTPVTREGRLCGHWVDAEDTRPSPHAERPDDL